MATFALASAVISLYLISPNRSLWVLYAITPYVYQLYHPHCVRGDILHIVPLLRNGPICGNNAPLAGRVIQIHTGVIAHINLEEYQGKTDAGKRILD
eukprot:sb/3479046/